MERGQGAPDRMGDWFEPDKDEMAEQSTQDNIVKPQSQDGMTRRDFLKGVAGAAVVLGTAAVVGKEAVNAFSENAELEHQKILETMRTSPTEKMAVRSVREEPTAETIDLPTTLDELRDKAGWKREFTEAFSVVLSEKNPGQVSEDKTIQPGLYVVPVNRPE